MEVHLEPIALG